MAGDAQLSEKTLLRGKFAFLNRETVTCLLPSGVCTSRISVRGCLYLTWVSKLVEADLKALSVTNCFPVQAPLLLSFPETS